MSPKYWISLLLLLCLWTGGLFAAVPQKIEFQGIFSDSVSGLLNGRYTITAKLYPGSSNTAVWTETFTNVLISNGFLKLVLGDTTAITPAILDQTSLRLGITIQGVGSEVFTTVSSAPYAILAKKALDSDQLGGVAASAYLLTDLSNLTTVPVAKGGTGATSAFTAGSVVFAGTSGTYTQSNSQFFWDNTNARLGIGTNAPLYPLDVSGNIRASGVIFPDGSLLTTADGSSVSAISGNDSIEIGADADSNSDGDIIFKTQAQTRLIILNGGNVGIATATPAQPLDVNGNIRTSGQFISTVATGTAPLQISSTTKVSSLNADLLDGSDSTAFATASHSHSASDITSGTLAIARGGTGLGTTPSNGQLLIGNGTGYTLATLTGGTGIDITNGSGTITVGLNSSVAGSGLSYSAGVLSVNVDDTTTQITGGQVEIKSVPASAISGSIANSKLVNSGITVGANSTSQSVSLGTNLSFTGATGISTALSQSGSTTTVTIAGNNNSLWAVGSGNAISYTAGNVGIGTSSPQYPLDVSGNVRISGVLRGPGVNNSALIQGFGALFRFEYTGWNSITVKALDQNNPNTVLSSKTFIINHPADPDKYLVHATIEGPEADVFYRGESKLKNGQMTVKLPPYFEALTRADHRTVLLTPKNGWSPLYLDGKVENGQFVVKTTAEGNPGQVFFWEVKAERKDIPRLTVEPQKSDIEVRGDGPYTYGVPKSY